MNTCAWGLHSACNCLGQHDGCCSSCCLSKSKTKRKNKSVKVIWNKIDSVFWTNCQCLTKRTGHYAWPRCFFSWSDCACNHPSCHRTCCFSLLVIVSRAIAALIVSMMIFGPSIIAVALVALMVVCNIYDCDIGGSSIQGYVRQEDEPFSFPLTAYPWRSSWECQPPCRFLDIIQRRQSPWAGQ